MPPMVRAVPAPTVFGKPSWHAWFVDARGTWKVVRNQHGNAIDYASEKAALDQADYAREQVGK